MQIGPYRILSELGRGGMSVVFLAEDADGGQVALKLLHSQQPGMPLKRFALEAKALVRLRHPNLVALREAGEHEGRPWLALDYVAGQTLQARLDSGPLPVWEAIRITEQLAGALSYVHSRGIVHRDLKPDNVLLKGSQALLTDFGLVLDGDDTSARITHTGFFLGTPGYWAPEQARGDKDGYGPHTDVYGLGAVLYACLTGNPPVQATTLQDFLQTQRFAQLVPPDQVRPEVPAWLSTLCLRCLAPEPSGRPESVEELARCLLASEAGAPSANTPWLPGLAVAAALLLAAVSATFALDTLRSSPPPETPPATNAPQPQPPHTAPLLPQPAPPESGDVRAKFAELRTQCGLHIQAHRHDEAVAVADSMLRLDPENPDAQKARAIALLTSLRFEEAILALDEAVRLGGLDAQTLSQRGHNKLIVGQLTSALADFERALALDPNLAMAHNGRGTAKRKLGRPAEALLDHTRALELNRRLVSAYAERGLTLLALGRTDEAWEHLTPVLKRLPNNALTFWIRGETYSALGRHAEALADFERALELHASAARAHLGRGRARVGLGRWERALADFERALELDPGLSEARIVRGATLGNLGRHEDAIAEFDRAVELDPSNADAYFDRGRSHLVLNHPAKALADLDKALELGLTPESRAEQARSFRETALKFLEDD